MYDNPEGYCCVLRIGDERHKVHRPTKSTSTLEYRKRVAGKCLTQTTYKFSEVPEVLKIDRDLREKISGADIIFFAFNAA